MRCVPALKAKINRPWPVQQMMPRACGGLAAGIICPADLHVSSWTLSGVPGGPVRRSIASAVPGGAIPIAPNQALSFS